MLRSIFILHPVKITTEGCKMFSFFLSHVPAFLTMGVSVIGATLLRAAAKTYAERDD